MSWVLGQCLGLMSGQPWKTLKAAVSPAIFHRAATHNLPVTRKQIGKHFRQLERTGNLSRGTIHPVQDMKMIPFFNVAWEQIAFPMQSEDPTDWEKKRTSNLFQRMRFQKNVRAFKRDTKFIGCLFYCALGFPNLITCILNEYLFLFTHIFCPFKKELESERLA